MRQPLLLGALLLIGLGACGSKVPPCTEPSVLGAIVDEVFTRPLAESKGNLVRKMGADEERYRSDPSTWPREAYDRWMQSSREMLSRYEGYSFSLVNIREDRSEANYRLCAADSQTSGNKQPVFDNSRMCRTFYYKIQQVLDRDGWTVSWRCIPH